MGSPSEFVGEGSPSYPPKSAEPTARGSPVVSGGW